MIVLPVVNAGVFILLVAVVGGVPLCFAMLAIGFWFLVHLLVIAHFHILKFVCDAFEKRWLALALVIFHFWGSGIVSFSTVLFETMFCLSLDDANKLVQAHVLEWITSGMVLDFCNISLCKVIPRGRQRERDDYLKEQIGDLKIL